MSNKIEKNTVVAFHYRLWDQSGSEPKQLETSFGSEPSLYLHGHQNIMPALEEAMLGRQIGDIFSQQLSPERAYGKRRPNAQQRVPIKHLLGQGKTKPKIGDIVNINTEQGPKQATVIKLGLKNVDVDNNHPLAGKPIQFDIEIIELRAATAEEIAHGHAHGPGGHQH